MAVPASRAELLEAIETSFARLDAELDRVPPEVARQPVLEGHVAGTTMSPADLLAYLIGWGQQILTWCERRAEGLPDEFPARGVKWNELGLLAQRYYAEREHLGWDDLRRQLRSSKVAITQLVEGHTDAELYGSPWYGKWTLGRMISLNTSSPYVNARGRLRRWLRTL
ncbi:ClbS/DfsB family four-helix bundle protein [Leucobacter massiliensis]|uniref:ClbS/DfsB family four-helix bundle protein n=1 Tax=Leucobacter massiliensis TaxID=1686285 RepID=A0A2S9QP83_9MICO|nr:ClbS/DfsB family four-helix bundle protein [Leucobacter massiliensis]PRI11395.1 hypothetical protein B4915_06020 [Leucobacter massiliensis]